MFIENKNILRYLIKIGADVDKKVKKIHKEKMCLLSRTIMEQMHLIMQEF